MSLRLANTVCYFDGETRTVATLAFVLVTGGNDEEEKDDIALNLSALCANAAATMSFTDEASRELLILGPTSSLMCGIFEIAGVFMTSDVFALSCGQYRSNVKIRLLSKLTLTSSSST